MAAVKLTARMWGFASDGALLDRCNHSAAFQTGFLACSGFAAGSTPEVSDWGLPTQVLQRAERPAFVAWLVQRLTLAHWDDHGPVTLGDIWAAAAGRAGGRARGGSRRAAGASRRGRSRRAAGARRCRAASRRRSWGALAAATAAHCALAVLGL